MTKNKDLELVIYALMRKLGTDSISLRHSEIIQASNDVHNCDLCLYEVPELDGVKVISRKKEDK